MNWLFLMILGLSQGMDYFSENVNTCTIDEDFEFMVCECPNRGNFTIGPIFDEIYRLTIKECDTVTVPFAAFANLKLESLEFSNLEHLIVVPFALTSIQGLSDLKIANITNLDFRQHAFVGLHNVYEIWLSNVTVDTLAKDALSSVSNVTQLIIENSSFFRVEELSFAIHNILYFIVRDSEFTFVEEGSFLIHQTRYARFKNCRFEDTTNSSFIFSFVNEVSFQNCRFGLIASMAMQSNELESFVISDSDIETLMPNAFAGLEIHKSLIFKNNSVQILYDDSLISFFSTQKNNPILDYCCNSFTCDCSIFWIWENYKAEENASLLETSRCINDRSKTLSLFTPTIDSYNHCLTIELLSATTDLENSTLPVTNLLSDGSKLENGIIFCMFELVKIILLHHRFGSGNLKKY